MKKGDIVVVKAIVARQYSGPHFGWDPYQVPPRVPGNSRMFDPRIPYPVDVVSWERDE
jgi:hypothetical protein